MVKEAAGTTGGGLELLGLQAPRAPGRQQVVVVVAQALLPRHKCSIHSCMVDGAQCLGHLLMCTEVHPAGGPTSYEGM